MNRQFVDLCNNGRFDEAKDLYQNKNIYIRANGAFMLNCIHGHLNMAQWIYSLGSVNIHENEEYVFRLSCYGGHLNVVQWLYSLGSVNIHEHDDEAFIWSCSNGHINIAQWMYSLGVNIHAQYDEAFVSSCYKGHISVAQWLYSLGSIHIHAQIEAFINSCYKNRIIIVEWLLLIYKFNDNMVDAYLPIELHEYAFNQGYLPNDRMRFAYVQYKNKIKKQISIFEIDDLVNIIITYV